MIFYYLTESPVPIVLGMQKLPPGWALPERYVVIDPGERIVHLNPFDLVQAQSILLPNGSRLVTALKPVYDSIIKLSAKAKKSRVKSVTIGPMSPVRVDHFEGLPTVNSPVASVTGLTNLTISPLKSMANMDIPAPPPTAVPPQNNTNDSAKPTCPLELDYENPDCVVLLGYIKQFVATVHNHILAIVNTAIHLQHVEKQAARDKRRVVANKQLDTLKTATLNQLKTDAEKEKNTKSKATLTSMSLDVGIGSFDVEERGKHHPKVFSTPPPKAPAGNAVTSADKSVDVYSDVTLSEMPVDETDQLSNASFASSSSSVPSLKSDAPLLAVKEIGQNGLKFVKQLEDTQMYSNYCQSLKMHSSTTTVDGSVEEKYESPEHPRFDRDKDKGFSTPFQPDVNDDSEGFDSITNLFEISLTGSIALEKPKMEQLMQIFEKLYPLDQQLKGQIDLSGYNQACIKEISKVSKSRSKLHRHIKKLIKSIATNELENISLDVASFTACNGLVCNGFCNTDLCSDICIQLWSAKLKKLRHHQVAYDIVSRKYEKKRTSYPYLSANTKTGLNDMGSPAGDNRRLTMESSGGTVTTLGDASEKTFSPKVEFITKVGGTHYEPFRHGKETASQYQLRKVIAEESMIRNNAAYAKLPLSPTSRRLHESQNDNLEKVKQQHHPHHHRRRGHNTNITAVSLFQRTETPISSLTASGRPIFKKLSITPFSPPAEQFARKQKTKTVLKKRKLLFDPDASRFTKALAKYYARKEEQLVKKYLKRSYARVESFLRKYVYFYRKLKFHHSISIVQAYVRGYLVRKDFYKYLEPIYLQKLNIIWNRMTIRNLFRRRFYSLLKNLRFNRERQNRLRLAKISIPIAPPSSHHQAANHNMKNNNNHIVGAAGNTSPKGNGIKGETPVPFLKKGVKYINEPTLNLNEGALPGSRSPQKKSEMEKMQRHSSGNIELDSDEISPAAMAAFGAPPARRSSTYAERARDFFQFGQILKRPSASAPKLPVRRRSTTEIKKSDGVAIESHSDAEGQQDRKSSVTFQEPGITSNNSVSSQPLYHQNSTNSILSSGGSSLNNSRDSFISNPNSAVPPLVPRKFSESMNIPPIFIDGKSKSFSGSGELDRSLSQDRSLGDLSSDTSLGPKAVSFMSISEEPMDFSSTEHPNQVPHHRASFLSRGFNILRSRSSESNASKQSKQKEVAPMIVNTNPSSPLGGESIRPTGIGSRDSYDDHDNLITLTQESLQIQQQTIIQEQQIFEGQQTIFVTTTTTMNDDQSAKRKSFPNLFNFDRMSPTRRSSRGSARDDGDRSSNNTQNNSSKAPLLYDENLDSMKRNSHTSSHVTNDDHSSESSVPSEKSSKSGKSSNKSSKSMKSIKSNKSTDSKLKTFVPALLSRAVSVLTQDEYHHGNNNEHNNQHNPNNSNKSNNSNSEKYRPPPIERQDTEELIKIGSEEDEDYYSPKNDDVSAEFEKYPLKSLGKAAIDFINRQQMTQIKKMWNLLRDGIEVIKHSKNGKPKPKTLFCDYAMTKLYWRTPGSKPDPQLSSNPDFMENNSAGGVGGAMNNNSQHDHSDDSHSIIGEDSSVVMSTNNVKKERRKTLFSTALSYDPFKTASRRKSSFGGLRMDSEREIYFKEILSVTNDGKSEVFNRSLIKQYYSHVDNDLITLTIHARTLDMEVNKVRVLTFFHTFFIFFFNFLFDFSLFF
jgi:hypothetical protein